MRWIIVGALCLVANCAHAQQPQQSPEVRALSNRVINELNANLQCSTVNNELKDKLTTAESEVKRLTDKYEPKKDDPKKDDPAK